MRTMPDVTDDSVIARTLDDTRPAGWWHLPAATTVMGLLALVAFGLRGIQERVALLNGQVEYGPRNAVWHLDVRIPVA